MKTRGFTLKICALACVFISLIFIVSCNKKTEKQAAERRINVTVQPAGRQQLRPMIEAVGTLASFEEVLVSSEIEGIIKELKVSEGSLASKGMLLAALDDTDYALDAVRAEAALKQAKAALENTKVEFGRKRALFEEQLVPRQQMDDVATRLNIAEAEADRAKASLDMARHKLSKTKILSPIAGAVKEKRSSRGDFVRNGSPMLVLIQANPLKLYFSVSEKDVSKIKAGQDISLKVDALPDKEFAGKVASVFPSLDDRTRTLQIEAHIPNPSGMLKPGLFAKVTAFTGAPKETVVVPATALLYEGDSVTVYVVEGEQARARKVKTGAKHGDFVEIVEGVKEAEQVVVVGQQNLAEGIKVNVSR
ncbi:MAG: efflux RND transporter periplasmic adaptor subunit [Nitrospirae bacterium]|nr:MAG: efflux RND transporter periplasmic adaptor subunit [Nitrospirota bacterium]